MNCYFDEQSQKLIVDAKKEMIKLKHPYVGSEHLFLAILHMNNLEITAELEKYGITYTSFRDKLVESVGIGKKESHWFLFTPMLKSILINASLYSENNNNVITPYYLLLSIFKEGDGVANRILLSMNVDFSALYERFISNSSFSFNYSKTEFLDDLAINMNQHCSQFDPVIGREIEIKSLIRCLLRKNKNNPLLLGEAGVGKTALVEELARLIATGNVPYRLKNATIFNLSVSSLIAGTKYRGEFEERFQKLLKEVKENPNIILFIDEIHTIIGAGGAEGAIDASNILKPYLARGQIKIIGATTVSEYSSYIEKDKAFSRRFQKIYIEEVKNDQLKDILMHLKSFYEEFHNVKISENIILKIISYSEKYILNGKQPDKAIDLLDDVCVFVSSRKNNKEKMLDDLSVRIKMCEEKKNNYIIQHNFKKAKELKNQEDKLHDKYNNIFYLNLDKKPRVVITENDLKETTYFKTKIPVGLFLSKKIKKASSDLKKYVYGQDCVINDICRNIINSNYLSKNKPLSFLFLGKKGVGKTFLSRKLGEFLVGHNNCQFFNMNDFLDEQSIYKIIGYPSSNKKSNFVIQLTENPFSVLIFDEINNAHPFIIKYLLDYLESGNIIDCYGNKYNCSKTIVIFTSSLNHSLGFTSDFSLSPSLSDVKEKVQFVHFFENVTKKKVISFINHYCKDNNVNYKICNSLIIEVMKKFDYINNGFCNLTSFLDNYISSYNVIS